MSCDVCGTRNPDKHHIRSRGAGGTDDDWNIIHLCRRCHTENHAIGQVTFIEKHGLEEIYRQKGWVIEIQGTRKRLVRHNT